MCQIIQNIHNYTHTYINSLGRETNKLLNQIRNHSDPNFAYPNFASAQTLTQTTAYPNLSLRENKSQIKIPLRNDSN